MMHLEQRRWVGIAFCATATFLAGEQVEWHGPSQDGVPLIRVGDIVAANLGNHSVAVFDGGSGRLRGYVNQPGVDSLVRHPTGVGFGPDGHLYVASSGNGRIARFDGASGQFLSIAVEGPDLERPFSILFDGAGDLLVSSGATVRRFNLTSGFVGHVARDSSLRQPIGLALGLDGLLYVVNSTARSVVRFEPSTGKQVDVFARDSLAFPSDLRFGPDGALYVSNAGNGTVARFDGRSGAFSAIVARLPDRGVPMGLALSDRGALLIGDFRHARIFELDLPSGESGDLRLLIDSGLNQPENIAVKPSGRPAPGRQIGSAINRSSEHPERHGFRFTGRQGLPQR